MSVLYLPTFEVIWDKNPNDSDINMLSNTGSVQEMTYEEFEAHYGFDVHVLDEEPLALLILRLFLHQTFPKLKK